MKPILIAGLSALTMMMCPEFANGQGILKRLKDGVQKEATRIAQDEVNRATNRVFSEGEKVLKGGSGKKSTNQERTDTDSSVSTTSKTSSNTTADKPLYTFDPNIDPRLQVQRDFEIYVHNREKRKFCCDAYQKWRRPHAEVLLEAGEDVYWKAIKQEAEEKGEVCMEVEIPEDKAIEFCMTFQEMQEVQHLKLKGCLYKWCGYRRIDELYTFLHEMPKLKSVDLRDVDCEAFFLFIGDQWHHSNLQWFIFPYNCEYTDVSVDAPHVIYPECLKVFGSISYGGGKSIYSGAWLKTKKCNTVKFPEGFAWIGIVDISNSTEKLFLPSTLRCLDHIQLSNSIKEIHIGCATPPRHIMFSDMIERSEVHGNAQQFKQCTLYVPKGCRENYLNAQDWRNFYNIVEE